MRKFFIMWMWIAIFITTLILCGVVTNRVFGKVGTVVYLGLLMCGVFAAIGSQDELEEYFATRRRRKIQRAETPVQRETEKPPL